MNSVKDILNYLIDNGCVVTNTEVTEEEDKYTVQFIRSKNLTTKSTAPKKIEYVNKKKLNIDVNFVKFSVFSDDTIQMYIVSNCNGYATSVSIAYHSDNYNKSVNKLLEEAQSLNLIEYVKPLELVNRNEIDKANLVRNMIANNLKLDHEESNEFRFEKLR